MFSSNKLTQEWEAKPAGSTNPIWGRAAASFLPPPPPPSIPHPPLNTQVQQQNHHPQMAAQQKRFLDKVVIITGSSSGIGRDAAVEFAREGAFVVIHGQNPEKLDETEKAILAADVPLGQVLKVIGSMEEREVPERIISATLARFGRIDVLINNAGSGANPAAKEMFGMDNLDFIYDVNFRSAVQLSLLALPHLEKTRGNILNIGSIYGIRPYAPFLFYAAMKAALDHWTRGFAQICTPKGVRINSLNPGPIDTPLFDRNGIRGTLDHVLADQTLMGRLGLPGEMSTIMKFLCSDEASYITGTTLLADGGWTVNAGLQMKA